MGFVRCWVGDAFCLAIEKGIRHFAKEKGISYILEDVGCSYERILNTITSPDWTDGLILMPHNGNPPKGVFLEWTHS